MKPLIAALLFALVLDRAHARAFRLAVANERPDNPDYVLSQYQQLLEVPRQHLVFGQCRGRACVTGRNQPLDASGIDKAADRLGAETDGVRVRSRAVGSVTLRTMYARTIERECHW